MTSNLGCITKALSRYASPSKPAPEDNVVPLDWAKSKPLPVFAALSVHGLGEGLAPNFSEIRSAVSAIPPSAIANEPNWMDLARALAHEAALHPESAEELYAILDQASLAAPGYSEADNRNRWDRYQQEALAPGRKHTTIATVFHLAKQHGWRGWSPTVTAPASAPAPIAWSAAELKVSFSNIPHRQWLYGTDLIRGEITVMAAPGGVGKTALSTGMAVAVATGTDLLEEKIWGGPELKVLFINGEDGSTEILRRVWALSLAHQPKLDGKTLDRLLIAGADKPPVQRLSFLRTSERASVINAEGFTVLEAALLEMRPDLVILDPLVAFCGGGTMNDNAVMSQVIRELKRIAMKFNCAVLVVHHTRKGADPGDAEAVSGAASIVNLARRAIMPVPMNDNEAKLFGVLPSERFRYLKLVDAKNNLAPRSTSSPWYELHSIELPNAEPPIYTSGDHVQAVTRVHLSVSRALTADEAIIQKAILEVVQRGKLIDGVLYPYSPSSAGANAKRALLNDAMEAVAAATRPREWPPEDLKAVTERSIGHMKDASTLVEETISKGRFRGGQGLKASQEALVTTDLQDLIATLSKAPPELTATPAQGDSGASDGADGVPFMITQAQKAQLVERGYAAEQIGNMTPMEAHEILRVPAAPEPKD